MRSVNLGIVWEIQISFKEVAFWCRVIFACFKSMRLKQSLTRVIEFQKENSGVTTHFSDIINLQFDNKKKKEKKQEKKAPYIGMKVNIWKFIYLKCGRSNE